MIKKIKELFDKYKAIILYLFFGICTMIINIVTYTVCYELLSISNVVSTIIAWILSVIGAYISNKIWVFESKTEGLSGFIQEAVKFLMCRVGTGIIDVIIMYVSVDLLSIAATPMKVLSNIIVVILNYVASKVVVFNKDISKSEGGKSGGQ